MPRLYTKIYISSDGATLCERLHKQIYNFNAISCAYLDVDSTLPVHFQIKTLHEVHYFGNCTEDNSDLQLIIECIQGLTQLVTAFHS